MAYHPRPGGEALSRFPLVAGLGMLGALSHTVVAVETPAPTPQGAPIIEEIVIRGNERVTTDRIRYRLRSRVGAPLRAQDVADDVRAINTAGPFMNGRSSIEFLDAGRVRLIFDMEELPLIGSVRFEGAGFWDSQSLSDKVETAAGEHHNPLTLEGDRRLLEEHFRKKNWVEVAVTVERIERADGLVDVVFRIDKGQPVKVARTIYLGLPDGAYKYFIDHALLFNRPGKPFNERMLDIDRQVVVNQLQDLGYLDAAVRDLRVERYDDLSGTDERRRHGPWHAPDGLRDDRAVLTFFIDSGERYRLGSISFIGNSVVSEEELRRAVGVDDGDWYRRVNIQSGLNVARDLIRDQGHARASFRIDYRPDLASRQMHLSVHVFEGDVYDIGRVDIDGNIVTKDAAIRRLLEVYPGDQYTQSAVDESRRQVARTGLFRNEPGAPLRLDPVFPEERPDEVDMDLEVHEAATGQLNASVGWVSGRGLVGRLEYTERNFDLLGLVTEWPPRLRGSGQTLNTALSYARERQSFSINWRNPHLFDSDFFLSSGFSLIFDDDDSIDYDQDIITTSASIGHYFFNRDLTLALGYRYTDRDISGVNEDRVESDVQEDHYYDHSIFADQTYDRTNSRIIPTTGWKLELSESLNGRGMVPYQDYFDVELKGHVFVPLYEAGMGGVTYLHLRHENRWSRALSEPVPFYNRYYAGGPYPKHRGFERNEMRRGNSASGTNAINLSGTTDWVTSLELSYPVQGRNDGIRLIGFYDLGYMWLPDEQIDLGSLDQQARQAFGFGIRFPMSLPVALDFAWLLDPEQDETRQQVHFSLGNILF
jgi:outer membrane protein insertion porin family